MGGPAGRLPVGLSGLLERASLVDAQEAVQLRLHFARSLEHRFHGGERGSAPLADGARELRARKREDLVRAHGAWRRCSARNAAGSASSGSSANRSAVVLKSVARMLAVVSTCVGLGCTPCSSMSVFARVGFI